MGEGLQSRCMALEPRIMLDAAGVLNAAGGTVDGEVLVNTQTTSDQTEPAVAALNDGGYVVAWASVQDGDEYGVYMQRYDANGGTVGNETAVNTTTEGNQHQPSVTSLTNGGFIVVWASTQGGDDDIYAQRYDSNGTPDPAGEFAVSTGATGIQSAPSITGLTDGGFVVTWHTNQGGDYDIYARRYDSNGAATEAEFRVSAAITNTQMWSSTTGLSGGGFVVTWASGGGQDGDGYGVFGRLYDASGNGGTEFQVNTLTTSDQSDPSVSALQDGGFVVAWNSNQGGDYDIYARRYTSAGTATETEEFIVNTTTTGSQLTPSVTGLSGGDYVVAWTTLQGSDADVYGQRFDANGTAVGSEFIVNATTTDQQRDASVAGVSDGGYVVAWRSNNQDGDGEGVYTHSYSTATSETTIEQNRTPPLPLSSGRAVLMDGSAAMLPAFTPFEGSGDVIEEVSGMGASDAPQTGAVSGASDPLAPITADVPVAIGRMVTAGLSPTDQIAVFQSIGADAIVSGLSDSSDPTEAAVGGLLAQVRQGGLIDMAEMKRDLLERGLNPETVMSYLAAFTVVEKAARTDALSLALADLITDPDATSLEIPSDDMLQSRRLPPGATHVALLIGIDSYQSPLRSLSTPLADVQAMSEVLQDRFGYLPVVLANPTKEDIVAWIAAIASQLGNETSLVVYYAGHGFSFDATGVGYWLPADANADSASNWISTRELSSFLGQAQSDQVMVISDSCFSGSLTKEDRTMAVSPDFIEHRAVTAMSSGGETPVADGGFDGHSIFAGNLLRILGQSDRGELGQTIHGQVRDTVSQAVPQVPTYGALLSAGHERGSDFVIGGRP